MNIQECTGKIWSTEVLYVSIKATCFLPVEGIFIVSQEFVDLLLLVLPQLLQFSARPLLAGGDKILG